MLKATISLQESGPLESQREEMIQKIDHHLSDRHIDLDPAGYFLIRVDRTTNEIVATHFRNTINERGLACDPETGEVIPCDGSYRPQAHRIYRGRTAKELSVKIIEEPESNKRPLTMLDHANYLGREFQKAEFALLSGQDYIQD
ncbi:hypothetical protein KFL_004830070 [Klebsormidium nitens]|uniref:DUF4346 domain-containing protein n=1 Tax=Klebsormidium nitens TaxID=105231 RepID=A0A1Y1IJX6_KLENI|nr:hypothetical protein KFL_004830070 [Klebsormidium nitens]|eukprot:GAQ89056.1 hypothetical protein KFL_004830070 [Klebsormidium nitens]